MQKYLLLLIISFFLVSCSDEKNNSKTETKVKNIIETVKVIPLTDKEIEIKETEALKVIKEMENKIKLSEEAIKKEKEEMKKLIKN